MKKILEVKKPIIACDVDDADLMAVLMTHQDSENYKKWFIRNYIDLWCYDDNGTKIMGFDKPRINRLHCFRKESTKHDYFDRPFPDNTLFDCELIYRLEMDRDTLEKKYDTIVDMVKYYIDLDFYLFFELDCFYIPVALFNQKIHYNDKTLIYGYDDEKQVVQVADFYGPFDRNISYKFREISYIDFVHAYSSYECSKNLQYERLLLFKYYEKDIPINKGEIKYALKRYLTGFDDRYNHIYFGSKCYDAILEELNKKYLDFKLFNYISSHAKAMNLRVKYLKELHILDDTFSGEEEFADFEKYAQRVRNMVYKFVVSQDRNVKEKVEETFQILKEKDLHCTQLLIEAIKGEENVYRWAVGLKHQDA